MTQFDESKHNRHSDGKFANKPHSEADGVSLAPTTPSLPPRDAEATEGNVDEFIGAAGFSDTNSWAKPHSDGELAVTFTAPDATGNSAVTFTVEPGSTMGDVYDKAATAMTMYDADEVFAYDYDPDYPQPDVDAATYLRGLQNDEAFYEAKARELGAPPKKRPYPISVETADHYPIRPDQFPPSEAEVTEENINKFLTAANLWHNNTEVLPYPDGQGYDINVYAPNNPASRVTVHAYADDNMGDVYDKTSEVMGYDFGADEAFEKEWNDPEFQASSGLTPTRLLSMFDADQQFFRERSRQLSNIG